MHLSKHVCMCKLIRMNTFHFIDTLEIVNVYDRRLNSLFTCAKGLFLPNSHHHVQDRQCHRSEINVSYKSPGISVLSAGLLTKNSQVQFPLKSVNHKWGSVAHSLSLSPSHHTDMTEIGHKNHIIHHL